MLDARLADYNANFAWSEPVALSPRGKEPAGRRSGGHHCHQRLDSDLRQVSGGVRSTYDLLEVGMGGMPGSRGADKRTDDSPTHASLSHLVMGNFNISDDKAPLNNKEGMICLDAVGISPEKQLNIGTWLSGQLTGSLKGALTRGWGGMSPYCRPEKFQRPISVQTLVYPYPLGAGSARPNHKKGRSRHKDLLCIGFTVHAPQILSADDLGDFIGIWWETLHVGGRRFLRNMP